VSVATGGVPLPQTGGIPVPRTGGIPLPRARAVWRTRTRVAPWVAVWGVVFACSWGGNQFSPLLLMYEERAHYSSLLVNMFLGVYVLGLAPALLVAGSLSDRHGRRPVMLVGVGAAVLGSALLACGPLGPAFLAAGRLCSGITVGIAMAVGNSWLKELSQGRWDRAADEGSGARRSSLAFTLGSGTGALVAGLIAQWGPMPEVLPFLVHIAVTLPFAVVVWRTPETHRSGGVAGPWWRQLRVPTAGHRRFTRVVLVAAPWIFASAAIGYGYLPTQLTGATGQWALVFATAATVVALGASSAIQPLAKRVHRTTSARGLTTAVLVMAVGIAVVVVAMLLQSVWVGIAANVLIGVGMGLGLVSGLLEVQRIATSRDLAGLTGVFYAVAYAGFLAPTAIAALAAFVPVSTILWVVVGLAFASWVLLLTVSRKHLPAEG
jgi:MFS family permease